MAAWPASTVECQQKECKRRSPRAHDQRQTLNLQVLGSDFSHLPSEQPAVPPERRHSPLGEEQEGQLGLSQLLGLDLREEAGCRKGTGKTWMSLFHDLKLQQILHSTLPRPIASETRVAWSCLGLCLVMSRAPNVLLLPAVASLSSAPGCRQWAVPLCSFPGWRRAVG